MQCSLGHADYRNGYDLPRADQGGIKRNRQNHRIVPGVGFGQDIKHRMRQEGAVFAGEVSAHYYFRDFSQADSGVVPFLLMLELISKRGRKLSEILEPYRSRYFITGEINTTVSDVDAKLAQLEETFGPQGEVSHLDGVSVTAGDWHFNVRPSNTEPLLRLNLEARSQELMERKRDEVLDVIRS